MTNFANKKGYIWYDGEMVKWTDAKTHVLTHTLHYGLGVFEGVRAYETPKGAAIFRLEDHAKRFLDSAKIFRMPIDYSLEELNQAQLDAVKINHLKSGYIRPMAFYGSEGMGLRADNLKVHIIVAAWEWGSYMGDSNLKNGIKVCTSSFTRHHVNIAMTKAKVNGNYVNSMLALQEAIEHGCDEALLLDSDGYVCEGSGENFFMIKNNIIYTPELHSALDGITRKTIIQLAKDRNIPVIEKRITRDEVYIADEAFFTGTAAEVTPIRILDGREIGSGTRGEITKQLQSDYFSLVNGNLPNYQNWLYYPK